MKKICISILLSIGVGIGFVYGAGSSSPFGQQGPVLLASVNIYDADITKGDRAGFYHVSFKLTTSDPKQDNVFYRVTLGTKNSDAVYIYNSNKPITLLKGKTFEVDEDFPIPKDINGNLVGFISVYNGKGLPLANAKIGSVLVAKSANAPFAINACTLSKKVYLPGEVVKGSCTITGTTTAASVVAFSLFYNGQPLSIASTKETISKGKASFTFPQSTKAGSYLITAQAQEGMERLGYTYQTGFLVEGAYSNILSVALDKPYYDKGDVASITVGLNVFATTPQDLYAVASLSSKDAIGLCGEGKAVKVERPGSVTLQIPISKDCNGYIVKVVLTSSRDQVLDTYTLSVPKSLQATFTEQANYIIAIGILLVLISAFIRSRK